MEAYSPGHVCIFLYVGGILVHSLLRRFSLEPAWGGKRVRPRNHGPQRSRDGVLSHPFPVLGDSTAKD